MESLHYLLPPKVKLRKEIPLEDFLCSDINGAVGALLKSKRVDFVLEGEGKCLLVEFKTNINFNNLSAAMTEMAVVKKFANARFANSTFTSSLHLFPYRANVKGLRELNICLGSPLDFIWVLCEGPQLKFDIQAIKEFRSQVDRCLV